jgi:hypothetical protein
VVTRFDVAGEGACMKRYTDPSFYTRVCSGSLVEFRKVHNQSHSDKVPTEMPKTQSVLSLMFCLSVEGGWQLVEEYWFVFCFWNHHHFMFFIF